MVKKELNLLRIILMQLKLLRRNLECKLKFKRDRVSVPFIKLRGEGIGKD
jgi:hypothetical protein